MHQLVLVVGQHRQHQKRLYIFCFPSSLVIGMLRSVPEVDRGAVIVSMPSIDRLEVMSAPVTPAGSLYFLRNSLDTKPWSSCEKNNDFSAEQAGESVWVFLHVSTLTTDLSGFVPGVYCDELFVDTHRQLLGWEMLHIQVDDVAVLLCAHLDK